MGDDDGGHNHGQGAQAQHIDMSKVQFVGEVKPDGTIGEQFINSLIDEAWESQAMPPSQMSQVNYQSHHHHQEQQHQQNHTQQVSTSRPSKSQSKSRQPKGKKGQGSNQQQKRPISYMPTKSQHQQQHQQHQQMASP